jgi:hypothetical protein
MTRIVTGNNATELAKLGILGCVGVDLDFASGHLYLNDGFIETTYSGHVYSPIGQFGGIEMAEEQLDVVARPITLTLSGVDASLVGTAQTEVYQNRQVTVYVMLINQSTGALVGNPETAWEGRMDTMTIGIDQNIGKITLNCEHRLRREPRIARYTNPDQQQAYAGDKFFDFVPTIAGFQGKWGDEKASYGGPARAPRGNNRTPRGK